MGGVSCSSDSTAKPQVTMSLPQAQSRLQHCWVGWENRLALGKQTGRKTPQFLAFSNKKNTPSKPPSCPLQRCGGRQGPQQRMFGCAGCHPGEQTSLELEGWPCPTVHPAAVASLCVEKGKASLLRSVSSTSWRTTRLWGNGKAATVKGGSLPACSAYC